MTLPHPADTLRQEERIIKSEIIGFGG